MGFFRIFQRLKQCLNVHDCNICEERGEIATALARVSTFHNFTRPKGAWRPWTWGQEGSWCRGSAKGPLKSGSLTRARLEPASRRPAARAFQADSRGAVQALKWLVAKRSIKASGHRDEAWGPGLERRGWAGTAGRPRGVVLPPSEFQTLAVVGRGVT